MERYTRVQKDGYALYINDSGPTIGVSTDMEKHILTVDGYAFKDLSKNGTLEPYEDWRLPIEKRAIDLAERMTIEEIAGLMLYSSHQAISKNNPFDQFIKKDTVDTRGEAWDLTEEQKAFLADDNVRHVLIAMVDNTYSAARWNNNAQAFTEKTRLGIPINISTDPRHSPRPMAEFNIGSGGDVSMWPEQLGLAATFSPEIVRKFGEIASKEYRAMGIATALSPQIDLATDPRWMRFYGTFGECLKLATDLSRAYCDGFQSSDDDSSLPEKSNAPGWGYDSVNAMVKHWPGGGSGEGGRDAHYGYGKYAVYPGGAMDEHLKPFTEGAFKLAGATKSASAVMPYYTVSWNYDTKNKENVGNSYSKYIITDLLREKYGFDGVICTDWGITHDTGAFDSMMAGKPWGVEHLSVAERHYKILMAGVDQYGGNNDKEPVLEAFKMGEAEHGSEYITERFRLSAKRLLRNIFRVGLFENPYVDPDQSQKLAGCEEFRNAGFDAQLKSIVMLKNDGVLPLAKNTKVYIPDRHIKAHRNFWGFEVPERTIEPIDKALVSGYFTVTDNADDADVAFCFIQSPRNVGYTTKDGYRPVNLQYRPYTAVNARVQNIAGTDDRSYNDKTTVTDNENDLDLILDTKKAMGEKPVIVFTHTNNPFVPSEFESQVSALLVEFSVEPKALMEIVSGNAEPSGLLPFQMPSDMETVEAQLEDVPCDMTAYTDSLGNTWELAYGQGWNGVIIDDRVRKYRYG